MENSERLNQVGFGIYREGKVKRLSPTHFIVKTESGVGSFLVQIEDGKWNCDCNPNFSDCEHRYAARLCSASMRPPVNQLEEANVKCRYCGSLDIGGSGFRYNAYGISKRYRCNECLRKFSVKYQNNTTTKGSPSEMLWLLAEIGMILSKLENLIEKASLKLVGVNNAPSS